MKHRRQLEIVHDRSVSKYAEPWAAGLSGL